MTQKGSLWIHLDFKVLLWHLFGLKVKDDHLQAGPSERELASFLMLVAVLDYDLVHVPPSLAAASRRILGSGRWVKPSAVLLINLVLCV